MANKNKKKFEDNRNDNRSFDKERPPRQGGKGRGRDSRNGDSRNTKVTFGNGYCGSENDPQWYNKLWTLIHDVTKIPFGYQVGRPIDYNNLTLVDGDDTVTLYDDSTPPGVMALDYLCIPGVATRASDGVNIAATGLFQNIRKNLSTVAAYASADVMMYVLHCDSILIVYNTILRNFGMLKLYSSVNFNYNRSLYEAQGWSESDVADFYDQEANYRARFNTLIYKASTIYMPDIFSIMKRHAWLFSNIFTDSVSPKAQIYMHNCAGIYYIDETSSEEGTSMPFVKLKENESEPAMKQLLDLFELLIEVLRNSDSMAKIASDMDRAFPGVARWKLAYCDENYSISPVYSKEVLSQIENTTILPDLSCITDNEIVQSVNKNIIIFNPTWTSDTIARSDIGSFNYKGWRDVQILNMHWDNPSSDDIAVATRNMVNLELGEAVGEYHLSSAGSDICVGAKIVAYATGNPAVVTNDKIKRYMGILSIQNAAEQGTEKFMTPHLLRQYVSFDWAPQCYACFVSSATAGTANPSFYEATLLSDYDNYTTIAPDLLDSIHNSVITSMWNVPQLGDVVI